MTTFKWMTLGALLGFSVAMGVSCGPAKCTASNCAFGCCDASGTCQSGSSDSQCGGQGNTCTACVLGQSCRLGQCQATSTGTGGGSSSGGGSGGGATGGSGGGATGGSGGGATGGGGGTADPLCARLSAADTAFFAGNATCSSGGFAIERNPSLLSQCNAGVAQCTSTDRTSLTSYAACVEGAQVCSAGNEAAALAAIQSCFANVTSISAPCQAALGGGSTGGGGGPTGGGGGGPSGGGGGVTGGGSGGGSGGGVTGGGSGGGGGVSCGPGNCSGCCNGTTCVASPSNTACGIGGNACINCTASGLMCNTSSCVSVPPVGGGTGGGPVGGGTGGGTPVGGGGGTTGCTSLGTFTVVRGAGAYDATNNATRGLGANTSTDPTDLLELQLWWVAGVTVPITQDLATAGTYNTCATCALLKRTCTIGTTTTCTGGDYLGRTGTMSVSSAPKGPGTFSATLSGVTTFREWNFTTDTEVAGGRCFTISSAQMNVTVQ